MKKVNLLFYSIKNLDLLFSNFLLKYEKLKNKILNQYFLFDNEFVFFEEFINIKNTISVDISNRFKVYSKFEELIYKKIKKKYLDLFFSLKIKYNRENIENGINLLYDLSGFKRPKKVSIVKSPLAAQEKANELYNEDSNKKEYYECSIIGNIYNLDKIIVEESGALINKLPLTVNFLRFKQLILSGIWDSIQLDDCCIVCQMPIAIYRNDKNQLHNESGPAIKWKDGYEIYVWNGINVNKDIILDPFNVTNINNLNLSEQKILQTRIGRRLFFKKFGFSVLNN